MTATAVANDIVARARAAGDARCRRDQVSGCLHCRFAVGGF